jgi:hypothetical protein
MKTEIAPYDEDVTVSEVVPMDVQARAEIDIQIATAKRWPRSIRRVMVKAEELATLNPEMARQCTYAKPIGGGKFAIGPSVRLAEIFIGAWGNLSVGSRVIAEDSRFLTAQGVCIDYESNVRTCIEVRRRITDKNGRTYSDDNIANQANAACSIALRNAIFRVIPKSLVETVRLKAAEVANGGESVEQLRETWLAYWKSSGIEPARVFALLGIAGQEDMTLEHVEVLQGLANAIREKETTIAEAFSAVDSVTAAWDRHKQSKSDALAKSLGASSEPAPTAEPGED